MARKNKRKRGPTVGRILPVISIRNRVYRELETIANRLVPVRALVWRLYGSRAALGRSHEQIRDSDWMDVTVTVTGSTAAQRRLACPARVWKATLDDVLADIKAHREAAKQAVIRNLYGRELDGANLAAKRDSLRNDAWFCQPLLRA